MKPTYIASINIENPKRAVSVYGGNISGLLLLIPNQMSLIESVVIPAKGTRNPRANHDRIVVITPVRDFGSILVILET